MKTFNTSNYSNSELIDILADSLNLGEFKTEEQKKVLEKITLKNVYTHEVFFYYKGNQWIQNNEDISLGKFLIYPIATRKGDEQYLKPYYRDREYFIAFYENEAYVHFAVFETLFKYDRKKWSSKAATEYAETPLNQFGWNYNYLKEFILKKRKPSKIWFWLNINYHYLENIDESIFDSPVINVL